MNLNNLTFNALMGQLKNKNPNGYNELQSLIHSGKSPDTVLNELLSSGRFTQQDIQNAQNYMNQGNGNNIRKF